MSSNEYCHPASISLREYVELFLQAQKSGGNGNGGGRLVVKCNLTHSGIIRFSRIFRGGENKGENAELQLVKELRTVLAKASFPGKGPCELRVTTNKSPSIISAEQFTQLLRQLKGRVGTGCPTTFSVCFAHRCHYVNKKALSNLERAGINLSVLRVEDILREAITDVISGVSGLAKLPCQKLRGLSISCDGMMLAAAHFMLMNSFDVEGQALSERISKSHYATDAYFDKLQEELRKLQGLPRGRLQERQNAIESGRRSSSLDPYRQRLETKAIKQQPSPKATPRGRNQTAPRQGSPWYAATGNSTDRLSNIMRSRTVSVLKSARTGIREIALGMSMYKSDYILSGGTNRFSKLRTIDGKWTIQCFTREAKMFHQVQGFVLRNADDGAGGLANPELHRNLIEVITSVGGNESAVEIEILLTSLPDKNNFLRQAIQFAEKLALLREIDNIIVITSFAGIEVFTVPSKQALRKMLKIGEYSRQNKVSVSLKPLHLQTVLNMMISDVLVSLCDFNTMDVDRGVRITGRVEELTTAMHLIRSSIKLTSGSISGNLTDDSLADRLLDKHHKHCESQLENVLANSKK